MAAVLGLAILAGSSSSTGRGDDQPRQLAKDGAWVQYQWDWERLDNGQTMSGKLTLSFVGSLVENGEPCRWIELKYVIPEGNEKGTLIEKLLIREKDLLESENPIETVLRTWVQFNDEPAYRKEPHQNNDSTSGTTLLWTPGAMKKAVAGTPRDIEYQQGHLKAAKAWSKNVLLAEKNQDGKVVAHRSRRYTSWLHADLPVGFAQAEIKDDLYNLDKTKILMPTVSVFLLQDTGTDAKSALPDCN
ncbi:MAG: hypothetical protein EXS05_06630 [Planctomycetaceae bacterium]|nr:hypothetical protein [Planctomycetaceae bacterium]